jgi:predicted nuclease of predicted toxin-antitoxin system
MPLSLRASGSCRLRREIQTRRESLSNARGAVRLCRPRGALVLQQALGGANDPSLIEVCQREGRALVTLDLDFANIQRYPPVNYCGIMVLRLGTQAHEPVARALTNAIDVLQREALNGRLWIVEVGRIRIHE